MSNQDDNDDIIFAEEEGDDNDVIFNIKNKDAEHFDEINAQNESAKKVGRPREEGKQVN